MVIFLHCLRLYFTDVGGSLTQQILQGPIGIGIGIVYGCLYGLMLQFIPSRTSVSIHTCWLSLTEKPLI